MFQVLQNHINTSRVTITSFDIIALHQREGLQISQKRNNIILNLCVDHLHLHDMFWMFTHLRLCTNCFVPVAVRTKAALQKQINTKRH